MAAPFLPVRAATPAKGPVPRWLAACCRAIALIAVLVVAAPAAVAAKNTPLGFELIPANYPNSTTEDIMQALRITAAMGSHSSFIWHWGDDKALPLILPTVSIMRQFGLKSLVQMGAIFLHAPAPPPGYVKSFGDPATRRKYVADLEQLALQQPDYIVLATEINLLERFNPAEFEYYKTLYVEAYNAVKRISPRTLVGCSYLYTVWFAEYYIDHKNVPDMLKPYDFIAFTAYPIDLITDGFYPNIDAIPASWFGGGRLAYPNARIIFSEVGWPSKWKGTPETQAQFVRALPRLMSSVKPEIVSWSVLHDMEFFGRWLLDQESVDFLNSLDVDIDALFAHFNGMGLLDGYGNPKPALKDASELVFAP